MAAAGARVGGAGVHAGGHSQHHGAHDHDDVDEALALLQLVDVAARHEDDALAGPRGLVPQSDAHLVLGDGLQVIHRVAGDAWPDVDHLLLGRVEAAKVDGVPGIRRVVRDSKPLHGDAIHCLLGDAKVDVDVLLCGDHRVRW